MRALWRPNVSIDVLQQRALILQDVRGFFNERQVLEVETPCLSSSTITDVYLEAMHTVHTPPGSAVSNKLYLQTSPEYAMKRLLAAGSGDIYQLCKAYRDDEVGRLHNPEFTLLEWYRVGFSMQQLIDEVKALLLTVLPVKTINQSRYNELFDEYLNVDPYTIATHQLMAVCSENDLGDYAQSLQTNMQSSLQKRPQIQAELDLLLKDSLLQVLFSTHIEPYIGKLCPMVVTDFPASQASLARLNEDGKTANRFEVYFRGTELANGFDELTDAHAQLMRFEQDNQKRKTLGLTTKPIDKYLLAGLQHGLPQCSGVALGIDRLLMLAMGKNSIEEVMSFNHRNC